MAFEKHELAILALMFKKRELLNEIDIELFEDPKVRDIFSLMRDCNQTNGSLTTRNISLRLDKNYDRHLQNLRRYLRDMPDEDLLLKMLGNKLLKRRILEIVPQLSNLELEDYEELKRAIIKAESLRATEAGLSFRRFQPDDYRKGDVGAEHYPHFLQGVKMFPGEIGIIEALPKQGKTTALVNLGVLYLLHGHRVYHWSLEIPNRKPNYQVFTRYSARLLGKDMNEIDSKDIEKAIKRMRALGGDLVVKDDPYVTLKDVRGWAVKGKPTVLIIDYADLIVSQTKTKEGRFQIREIYMSLRNLAKELNIPLITASQSDIKGRKKSLIDIENLEEAKIVKAGMCSWIVSLNQTPEEQEEGLMRCFVALSTHGVKTPLRKCEVDFSKQLIKEIRKGEN